MAHAIKKYLARYAEPEAKLAASVRDGFARVLVVPVRAELPEFLVHMDRSAGKASGKSLAILVVNGTNGCSPDVHDRNGAFLDDVCKLAGGKRLGTSGAWLGRLEALHLLLIDRASPSRRFSDRDGVGLARKIGSDLALALYDAGLGGPWLLQTDADVVLPEDYFSRLDAVEPRGVAAACLPFWHESAADSRLSRAICIYEASLRYFVAGLRWAGSPYAFHTVGSAMAVTVAAYAAVRGYPRRLAGEDFYLLNKAAKIGRVQRVGGVPLRVRPRRSLRTPFGTGRALETMLASDAEPRFYDPRCFETLRAVLRALEEFAVDGHLTRLKSRFEADGQTGMRIVGSEFERLRAWQGLERLSAQRATGADLLGATHAWFDSFRTLKLIHALRDGAFPKQPWSQALQSARFLSPRVTSAATDPGTVRDALWHEEEAETARPVVTGERPDGSSAPPPPSGGVEYMSTTPRTK